jgi:hypothetical protein
MKNLICFGLFLLVLSIGIQAEVESCKAYKINGDNQYGHFEGQIQIKSNGDINRIVRYNNPYQSKYNIEELWTSKKADQISARSIVFKTKKHNFLSVVGNESVSKEEYQSTDEWNYSINDLEKNSILNCEEIYDLENRRIKNEIKAGLKNSWIASFAKFAIINKVIKWYREQPLLDPYRDNQEFKDNKFYTVDDLTDRDFYIKNPDVLRIRNSTINEFTLNEALLRNSAYSHSIEEKVKFFDENTRKYNINKIGLFSYVIGDELHADGDSSLWSAMYLSSQASRYLVTKDPVALANFKKSLEGLITLVNICPDESSFARAAMPNTDKTRVGDDWKKGDGEFGDLLWLPGGNNDMIQGLFLGFTWAYKLLPENDPDWLAVRDIVLRLENVKLKRVNSFNQVYIKGLKTLFTKDERSYQEYLNYYLKTDNIADLFALNRPFYIDGITDWSGTNLNMIGSYMMMLMSEEIAKREVSNEDNGVNAKWIVKKVKENLVELHQVLKYAKRDYLCLMAYSSNKEKLGPVPDKCWLSFIETPMEQPSIQLDYDRSYEKDFIISSTPSLPWKSVGKRRDPIEHTMSNKNFPKFEGDGIDSQLMWKANGFGFHGSKTWNKHVPRVDFLFSYWTYQYLMKR